MDIEIEAKFLDINPDDFKKVLENTGAKLIHEERLMIRNNFDFPDARLEKIGGWVRVRDEGDRINLSYKRLVDRTLDGMQEITVEVNNFKKTCDFLLAVGFDQRSSYETKREKWDMSGVEITIDTWPWIPTFIEIEGTNEQELKKVVGKLGLDWKQALFGSVEIAYQRYYNVCEEEIDNWEEIKFIPTPDWLEIKRK